MFLLQNLKQIALRSSKCFCTNSKISEGSLMQRFAKHLYQNKSDDTGDELSRRIAQTLKDVPLSETIKNIEKSTGIISECQNVVAEGGSQQIYNILDVLIHSRPHQIRQIGFFHQAILKLLDNFRKNPQQDEFVKLCFLIGQWKKNSPGPELLNKLLDEYLDTFISSIKSIDLAIICTASFKAVVKLDSLKLQQRLIKEIVDIEGDIDSYILVAFIKTLRQNKIHSPEVIKKLEEFKENGQLNKLSSQTLIHIFPIIADGCIASTTLIKFMISRCIETLDDTSRAKDIQKFLWSCSMLNEKIDANDFQKLEHLVMKRTDNDEYQKKFDNFVNVALSMWILNFRPEELIKKLLLDPRLHLMGNQNRIKLDSRKKLLLTCIEIEQPNWLKELNIESDSFNELRRAPKYLIKPSLVLAARRHRLGHCIYVQQIKHINIAGILAVTPKGKVHYELLDSTNTLSDNISPTGILQLKLRLLKKCGCLVKLVC